jgi:hypothetical protein
MPGVQKPHCSPCSSQKPFLQRMQLAALLEPSTVMTLRRRPARRSTVHDFTGSPSSSTVQAPQWRRVAADVRAGQPQVLAQEVDEQQRGSTSALCSTPLTVTLGVGRRSSAPMPARLHAPGRRA